MYYKTLKYIIINKLTSIGKHVSAYWVIISDKLMHQNAPTNIGFEDRHIKGLKISIWIKLKDRHRKGL